MDDGFDSPHARLRDRRGFERAIHDGAQQDLIALCVRVQLLRDAVAREPGAVPALLEELEQEARAALDRIRVLAGEIYPAILDARGLPDALHELARRSSSSATVSGVQRHGADLEAAVYFFCCALAGPGVHLRVSEDAKALRIEIDGAATRVAPDVRELVESVGGTVDAAAGGGVHATVPLPYSTFER